jgi:hypothetical protein
MQFAIAILLSMALLWTIDAINDKSEASALVAAACFCPAVFFILLHFWK